jgi:heat shock protein HslJ
MKTYLLLIVVIASLLVTACAAPAQPAPAQPTQAPAAETPVDAASAEADAAPAATPVAEEEAPADADAAPMATPVAEEEAAAGAEEAPAQDSLTANPWQWVSFTNPVEQFDVEMPQSYLLTFNEDGTINIVADCNLANGTYTDDEGALTIEIGPMTMAACPEGSRSDQFVQYLGFAARTFFQEGMLYIDLFADGGTMAFDPADPELMADDGEGALAGAPSKTSLLPAEALKNATYSGIYDEPITLTDGLYEDPPFTVQYQDGAELHADLNGDGVHDAVVFLLERGGGTANILYIAAQLNQDGQPVDAGAVRLDEVQVKRAEVAGGQVHLEIITMGPGDGDCCPSHKASKAYALQEGQLAEIAGEEGDLERISAADLNGTAWTLVELNYDTPTLADAEVTISFQGEQISGSGGCNTYNTSFILGEDNPFVMTVEPVISTQMACPEPIMDQESAYLMALEDAAQWGYQFGHLALYYLDAQGMPARLLYAPQAPEIAEADTLTGQTWQLDLLQEISPEGVVDKFPIENLEAYAITFGVPEVKMD